MGWTLDGKTCLVTGATAGIGRETALGLARAGAEVVIVGRDAERARDMVAALRAASRDGRADCLIADLSLQSEVNRVASEFRAARARLDVLVNNAGGVFTRRTMTAEGFERTWALDHLAYAGLTLELLPLMRASAPARIINVASQSHAQGVIDFDDLGHEKRFGGMRAYGRAKLANVVFTYALARRLEGTGITVNCLHPGVVASEIGREMHGVMGFVQNVLVRRLGQTPAQGAETSIYLASSSEVDGVTGQYFHKCRAVPSSRASQDVDLQERLWRVTLSEIRKPDPMHSFHP